MMRALITSSKAAAMVSFTAPRLAFRQLQPYRGGAQLRLPSLPQHQRFSALSQPASSSTKVSGASLTGSFAEREQPPAWDIKMLYDGDCPLCLREVDMLRKRDEGVGKIAFVDIADPAYDPKANAGISFEAAMGEIHAILPDGKVLTNIDVFKRLYEAVGLGWVYKFAEIEPLRKAANSVYGFWAKYRLPITGRPDFATVLRERNEKTCR